MPTKSVSAAGSLLETTSDYMAVFEITTDSSWAKALILRLEQRLVVTVSRARQQLGSGIGILAIVAIVGVRGVYSCQRSVPMRVSARVAPLLNALMQTGRFVFDRMPYAGSPAGTPQSVHASSPVGGAARGAAAGGAGGDEAT